jgi:predicted DCC family thiol-disulfide oxidoreductase YuxK
MPDVALYDGHCRICTAGARRLSVLARPGTVELRDFQEPGVLAAFPSLTLEQCMQALQLVTPEGRVFAGAEAVVRILTRRRILGAPAWLYYLPGVRWVCDAAYAWIARNRYRLSGAEACDDAGCAVHRPPATVQSHAPMRSHRLLLIIFGILAVATVAFWMWKPVTPTAEDKFRADADMAGLEHVRQAFLKGDWKQAFQLLEPYKAREFTAQDKQLGVLADEVHRIMNRVNGALQKANRGGELFSGGDHQQAAKLMAEAAGEYPENRQLRFTADYYEGIVAFDQKNYDLYLRLAEENARRTPGGPAAALWLANARATRYAVTGKPEDRRLAEEALARAEDLGRGADPEAKTSFDHIRQRIETRQIVDPAEYDGRGAPPRPGGR